jgi:hypothetical protein
MRVIVKLLILFICLTLIYSVPISAWPYKSGFFYISAEKKESLLIEARGNVKREGAVLEFTLHDKTKLRLEDQGAGRKSYRLADYYSKNFYSCWSYSNSSVF